jgi:hypothetical protein
MTSSGGFPSNSNKSSLTILHKPSKRGARLTERGREGTTHIVEPKGECQLAKMQTKENSKMFPKSGVRHETDLKNQEK